MKTVTAQDIEFAYETLKDAIHFTTLDRSRTFSEMAGQPIYLKLENLQKTGSFKIRGAYHKIASLSDAEKSHGVIAASAGNHAQGVAYAAGLQNIPATIVMPEAAPLAKVMASRGYGAKVVLYGSCYDEAYQKAAELKETEGLTFIHAFNDPQVIAGQGTIGLEILQQLPSVDQIFVPIGGGGLAAGIGAYIKAKAPHVKVIGVEASGAASMYLSKARHVLTPICDATTIADGIAVKVPGDLTFPIIDETIDEIVLVEEEEIAAAILLMLERSKLMVEGAGAVSLAAALKSKGRFKGNSVCLISGGNIDVNFIARMIERGLVQSGRRVKLATLVPDRPGALQHVLALIAQAKANVVHVLHDRIERQVPIGQAVLEISLETRDSGHTAEIVALLQHEGYQVTVI
ncbi:MAG: threonine ammonia-lyase [Sporomusaceae bacterium]|nr:threonine ammonia-lyase [Sporomusaceae bacterium]